MDRKAATVDDYLASLAEDRRAVLSSLRQIILKNLDKGFEEGMQYGMIGYYVPHRIYPAGYHCDPKQPLPFAGLCSQKNHMSLYLMGVYGNPAQEQKLRDAWAKAGKKLDMGKACIRFRALEDVPLEALGQIIKGLTLKKYVAQYEAALPPSRRRPAKEEKDKESRSAGGTRGAAKKAGKTRRSAART
jgi:hypothetical protein